MRRILTERRQSAIYLALALSLVMVAGLQDEPAEEVERTSSIPATVCPKFDDDARATALLPSDRTQIKSARSRKTNFNRARINPYALNNNSIVVEGSEATSVVLRSRTNNFTAATTCLIGDGNQWFVGANAGLGSRARILAVNSGLSASSLEIQTFDRDGEAGSRAITIPPVSQREIRVDSLAPGADATAIRVLTRSGRVSAYVIDERSRGLQTFGGDFVASQSPSTSLTIAGIPARLGGRSITTHRVEIVATGARAAVVDVELLSDGSRFTPVGLSEVTVQPGQVKRLRLPAELGRRTAAIVISATEEVAAAVISATVTEFAWSTPSLALDSYQFNVGGLEPVITLAGRAIRTDIEYRSRSGKSSRKTLTGSEIVTWKVPENTRRITITNLNPVHMAATWSNGDGFTSLALNPGTELERSSTPTFDIDALFGR
ncbi:MAG: DUF5719 family protein [Candidatus Nanopelagicaceae bacterium]